MLAALRNLYILLEWRFSLSASAALERIEHTATMGAVSGALIEAKDSRRTERDSEQLVGSSKIHTDRRTMGHRNQFGAHIK